MRDESVRSSRRGLLKLFVNAVLGAIAAGLATVLGAFALRPAGAASHGRWVRAGTLADLQPGEPQPVIVSAPRQDGWYRERGSDVVFLTWDGASSVRAMSAICTHLGCRVAWESDAKVFRCPCHGGVYDAHGRVAFGPPPRPMEPIEVRVEGVDGVVLVRL